MHLCTDHGSFMAPACPLRPQLMPVEERIEFLQENYGFNCECQRCTAELMNIDKVQVARCACPAQHR